MGTHLEAPLEPPAGVTSANGKGGRALAVRIGAFLFLGGAALTVIGTILPHPSELEVWGYLADTALQLIAAAIILWLPGNWRRAPWVPGMIVVVGIAAVSAAVYFNGERLGGSPGFNEFFYVWPAFYIGYFFKRRAMILSLLLIAAVYAGVLVAIGVTGAPGLTRWIVTVSVVAGAATAMYVLRRSIDRLLKQLREAARTDPLTMLLNRRGLDERFELELERARRTGAPVSLLVGDLDRFKQLNDRLGHPAGDTALALVGQALALSCRKIDTVARVGGEEFAILLPATGAIGGMEAAERLREEIGEIVDADGQGITISFGVAEFPTHGEEPRQLMYEADGALYAAKSMGRDRSVLCGSEEAATSS